MPTRMLALVGVRQAQHDIARRHQHARRAIAALQRVLAREGGAQLGRDRVVVEPSMVVTSRAVAGDRKVMQERAGMSSSSTRAGAADAVLAAEMRAGQIELLAQEIGQMRARLDRRSTALPLTVSAIVRHCGRLAAIARRSTATWICRSSGVGHSFLRQHRVGDRARRTLRAEIAGSIAPPNSSRWHRQHDRRGSRVAPITTRADAASRIDQTAPMASANSPVLRQHLVVAPARRRPCGGTSTATTISPGASAGFKRADHEIVDATCAHRLRTAQHDCAPSAASTETQSAAGSAWPGCRRWCRGCAPRGRRSARPRAASRRASRRGHGRPRYRHG